MTREEAIYVLKNTAWLGSEELVGDVSEAIQMAVNALKRSETHLCDTISRQAAIDALKEERCPCESDYDEGYLSMLDKAIWIMQEWLPSAQPGIILCKECKHWIGGYITDQDDFIPPKCGKYQQYVGHSADDYCSYAERR